MDGASRILSVLHVLCVSAACLAEPAPSTAGAVDDETATPPFRVLVVPAISNHWILPHEPVEHALPEATIELTACRREYESGSFVIQAGRQLTNVRLAAQDLTGPAGTIPASAIDLRVVKVWHLAGDFLYIREETFRFGPELLLKDDSLVQVDFEKKVNTLKMDKDAMRDADELQPFDVPANTVKQCWMTLQVPPDAAAGEYGGAVFVRPDGETAIEVPIRLRVLPFDLDEPNMICSMYYRGKLGAKEPTCTSEQKTEEQMLAEFKDMFAHGVTHPNVYVGPNGKNPDGTYDLTNIQRVFDLRKQAGMVGGPLLMLTVNVGSPPELLKATMDLATQNGFKEVYFAAQDEAKGDGLRKQRAAMKRVHEMGAKVFVANFADDAYQIVGDLLDLPVMAGSLHESKLRATARSFRSIGRKVMSYANPQGGMEWPENYRRHYGLELWHAGLDGACTYAYQHSFGHAWDDFDGASGWPLRDHNMAYPTVNGVIPTMQWEGYREGYDDLRYVATLENLIEKHTFHDGAVGEAARTAQHWLMRLDPHADQDPGARRGVYKGKQTLDEIRASIVEQILILRRVIADDAQ